MVRLMIWSEILYKRNKNNKKARKQTYDDIFHKMQIPHTNGKPKDWHPWVNVWTSGSYKLTDFGKEDFENLFELLIDSIDKTYSQMKKKYLVYLYQYKELFVNFS